MKKIVVLLAGVVMLTSCGNAETGMFSGAAFGTIIGSCIGGISGGPRGSDIGTLVGMATGAAAGAAIGAANEEQYYARAEAQSRRNYQGRSYYQGRTATQDRYDESGYSNEAVYDDVITMQNGNAASEKAFNDTTVSISALQSQAAAAQSQRSPYPVLVQNVSFINDENTVHISRGELVKISFEIRNTSNSAITQLVPTIQETTGNKRLMISPATMIESLAAKGAIRYTVYISAQKNLKTGNAHFVIGVKSGSTVVSNVEEIDVPLN